MDTKIVKYNVVLEVVKDYHNQFDGLGLTSKEKDRIDQIFSNLESTIEARRDGKAGILSRIWNWIKYQSIENEMVGKIQTASYLSFQSLDSKNKEKLQKQWKLGQAKLSFFTTVSHDSLLVKEKVKTNYNLKKFDSLKKMDEPALKNFIVGYLQFLSTKELDKYVYSNILLHLKVPVNCVTDSPHSGESAKKMISKTKQEDLMNYVTKFVTAPHLASLFPYFQEYLIQQDSAGKVKQAKSPKSSQV